MRMPRNSNEEPLTVVRVKGKSQESNSIYVPPPLRLKASSNGIPVHNNSDCESSRPKSCSKEAVMKEFVSASSTTSAKKCENSYMLFGDINVCTSEKSSPRLPHKSTLKSNNPAEKCIRDIIDDVYKKKPCSSTSKQNNLHKMKMCDNSYLLFSNKNDIPDKQFQQSPRRIIKANKKHSSVKLQDSVSKVSNNELDLENELCNTFLDGNESTSLINSRKCKDSLGKSSKGQSICNQKKCDNSSLLFYESSSQNSFSAADISKHTLNSMSNVVEPDKLGYRFIPLSWPQSSSSSSLTEDNVAISFNKRTSIVLDKECNDGVTIDDNSGKTDGNKSKQITLKNVDILTNISSTLDTFDKIDDYVVEFCDFPVTFKTQDFMSIFSCYSQEGFQLKWVDDTHALGIFTNPFTVAEVMKKTYALLKVKTLQDASELSQEIAFNLTLPSASRPRTCPSLARRLVSGALGLRVAVSDEVQQAEKKMLLEAKAERKLAAKQREEAWEGTLR